MRLASIVGARPQFIKAALLSRELRKENEEILIHTGQHYDYELSKIFFSQMEIPEPDYNLGAGSGSHSQQTARMLIRIERVLLEIKPDLVIVYGDTNTTLAGALVSAKLKIPLAHIEAGLRSFILRMPEEINRRITDHISSLLFCPTKRAVENLRREGIRDGVYEVGDVMYDALLYYLPLAEESSHILETLKLEPKGYSLITIHREENTENLENLKSIVEIIESIPHPLVFPVHPRTHNALKELGLGFKNPYLKITEPVSYLDMLNLEKNARFILTDSGGVQKEACWLRVPCLTLREETEWPETIITGWNVLVGRDKERVKRVIDKGFKPSTDASPLFGNGKTSKRIAQILRSYSKL